MLKYEYLKMQNNQNKGGLTKGTNQEPSSQQQVYSLIFNLKIWYIFPVVW